MTRLNTKLVLLILFLASTLVEEAMPFVFKVKSASANAQITLKLNNVQDVNGIAQLEWNDIVTGVTYSLQRSNDNFVNSNLTISQNISGLSFNDTITNLCQERMLYYRVESSSGSVSNIVSANFTDNTPPADANVNVVTINDAGLTEIIWNPSKSTDATSYSVLRLNSDGTFLPYYEDIPGLSFEDNTNNAGYSDPCIQVITYVLITLDQCDNQSPGDNANISGNYKTPLNTILLEQASACGKKINLKWNAYNNMVPAVTEYKVEVSIDNGGFNTMATVAPGAPMVYTSDLLDSGSIYRHRVTATNGLVESSSCILEFLPVFTTPTIDITNVTVVDEYVEVSYSLSDPAPDSRIVVFRKIDDEEFREYKTISWDGSGSFDDTEVDVNNHKYTYQLKAYDACDNSLDESNEYGTILLKLEVSTDGTRADFMFNRDNSTSTYMLYRSDDGVLTSFPIAMGAVTATNNIDRNNFVSTYFFIEVTNPDGTVSRSNIVQLPSKIRMPTAFRPGGEFPIYKPFSQNIQKPYLFIIFNRWGQELFRTMDPEIGWDGDNSQPGAYAYRISYNDYKGEKTTQLGWFIVIK